MSSVVLHFGKGSHFRLNVERDEICFAGDEEYAAKELDRMLGVDGRIYLSKSHSVFRLKKKGDMTSFEGTFGEGAQRVIAKTTVAVSEAEAEALVSDDDAGDFVPGGAENL